MSRGTNDVEDSAQFTSKQLSRELLQEFKIGMTNIV